MHDWYEHLILVSAVSVFCCGHIFFCIVCLNYLTLKPTKDEKWAFMEQAHMALAVQLLTWHFPLCSISHCVLSNEL